MGFNFQKDVNQFKNKLFYENMDKEYKKNCYSEKNPDACHLLGNYFARIEKIFEKAAKVYRSNCDDYGYARSCYKYGNYTFSNLIDKRQTGSVSKDDAKVPYEYLEKGCKLNDAQACLQAGLLLVSGQIPEIERNVSKSVDYLTKSCDMKNAIACSYLSKWYISGVPNYDNLNALGLTSSLSGTLTQKEIIIKKDMKKAFEFTFKGCELRDMMACVNLSDMYARGKGTEKNLAKSEKYKKIALELN